jgi:hypothetical protein
MTTYQNSELVRLFTTYTAGPDSIGARLAQAVADRGRCDPLIAATSADIVLYPGDGRDPMVEGIRLSTRGFKELAAVSHLGPAVASLVAMRALLGDGSWQADARRLLSEVETSRAANDVTLWRDRIEVDAYRGREKQIADLVDYSCAVTARYLRTALADESYLSETTLRTEYLEGGPVPLNHVMVATFFLIGMDISHRLISWFTLQDVDWKRAMVVVAGQQGRPTAGVTWNTSSVATMIRGASGGRLPMDRMYLAPHAPTFASPTDGDLSEVIALEEPLRRIWYQTRATIELGPIMFSGYPRFAPGSLVAPELDDPLVTTVTEMPAIRDPQDMRAMVTRLRVVLEDPRQLLSGCVTDYAIEQLAAVSNDPTKVVVPGLTGVSYPTDL